MNKKTSYTIRDGLGRFIKNAKPIPHKKGCKCFRCDRSYWKGRKHTEDTKKKISIIQREKSPYKQYQNRNWFYQKYWIEGKSYREIAEEVNASMAWVQKWMERLKIPRRPFLQPKFRETNPKWKGGKRKSNYIYILCRNHPSVKNKKSKYVPEHILVMEKHLGRYLKKNEAVHHLNGDKCDNRIENLLLLKNGQREHQKLEQKILLFAKQLIWGELKPELKKELQKLFEEFSNKGQ